jgi:hypothetical protein
MMKAATIMAFCVVAFLIGLKFEPAPNVQAEEAAALVSQLFMKDNGRFPRDNKELALAFSNPKYAFGLCLMISGSLQPIDRYDITFRKQSDGMWRVQSLKLKPIYEPEVH